jgi:hypothetical protein
MKIIKKKFPKKQQQQPPSSAELQSHLPSANFNRVKISKTQQNSHQLFFYTLTCAGKNRNKLVF